MEDFKQDRGKRSSSGQESRFGERDRGKSSFSGKSRGESYNRDRGPVAMHPAVCDQCGKACEVPFRPTEGKPIYCTICFGEKKNAGKNKNSDRTSNDKFNKSETSNNVNSGSSFGKGNNNDLKKQVEILNVKMDRLIKAVEAMNNTKPFAIEEKKKEKVKPVQAIQTKKVVQKASIKKTKKKTKITPSVKVKKVAKTVLATKAKKIVKKTSKKTK